MRGFPSVQWHLEKMLRAVLLGPVPCSVFGCPNSARSGKRKICGKHTRRLRLYGEVGVAGYATNWMPIPDGDGYIIERIPTHPLAGRRGYVRQHRRVLYDKLGPGPQECWRCGDFITWDTLAADHIDGNKANNSEENLVASCNLCNTLRG